MLAANTIQGIGITASHTRVSASPILAGFSRRLCNDFVVLLLPNMYGAIALDIPYSRGVRMCAGKYVLTQQASDYSSEPHCDPDVDDITDMIVVPSDYNWKFDYIPDSVNLDELKESAEGEEGAISGSSIKR